MEVDPSLQAVRESAFLLDPNTGLMTLNMQPNVAMHGMFEFNVIATDTGECNKLIVALWLLRFFERKINGSEEVIDFFTCFQYLKVIIVISAEEIDTTQVRIYMISTMNRVTFSFLNTVAQIEEHRDFVSFSDKQ